jgi:hypothetical protein
MSDDAAQELYKALILVGEMGFIVGLSFGIVIGWILHSCLKQYYKEN